MVAEPWPLHVLTTFTSYGSILAHRRGELIRALGQPHATQDALNDPDIVALIAAGPASLT